MKNTSEKAKALTGPPLWCPVCGKVTAYDGAVYCGAACCALAEERR